MKVPALTDDPTARTSMVGSALAVGALAAMTGNALFGRLSDRTTSCFGRRRPWLVGGALVMAAGLFAISRTTGAGMLMAGWLSERTGRRKLPVALASVLFAAGTYVLMHVDPIGQSCPAEALPGIAFGIYMSVDRALVLKVLPDPEDTAKDLGVFNLADAMPQSLAPGLGAVLLAYGASGGEPDHGLLLAAAAAVAGAFVLPSRK